MSDRIQLPHEPKARLTNIRSEGFFTYSRGAYTNFRHEKRKMRKLFLARREYSTHFTRRVKKKAISEIAYFLPLLHNVLLYDTQSR